MRGRGLIQGIDCPAPGLARAITARAFQRGLVLETSGPEGNVAKIMPPLVIEDALLEEGLEILAGSVVEVLSEEMRSAKSAL